MLFDLTKLCFIVLEDVVAEDLENEAPSPDNAEQTVLSATVLFVFSISVSVAYELFNVRLQF